MKRLVIVVYHWLPVFIWAFLIFYLSSLPIPAVSAVGWQEFAVKKFAHMVVYGVLAILLYRTLKFENIRRAAILSVAISALYGVTDEYHQSFTPGRGPSIKDVIFDTIGAYLAVYVLWKYLRQKILTKLLD